MADLVFELGCEELPAGAVARASADLERHVVHLLDEQNLVHGEPKSLATPRRLILSIPGLPEGQADSVVEKRGPSDQAAFDADGKPTKALEGFCRGAGIDPSTVVKRDGYAWAEVHVKGKSTLELLAEILPTAVKSLTFDKTMRWGSGRMRFARPVRWIVAVLDGQTVKFEIEGVPSGNFSRGHRFDSPEPFPVSTFDQFVKDLRTRNVEPDPESRRTKILTEAKAVAKGAPDLPEALVDENVFLTEWPTCHLGSFEPSFLDLPDPVLVTAMAKHERFFPVRDEASKITNTFVSVRNSGDEATVRAGNEWVLNARFNDAQFFFKEDHLKSLDDFLALTDRMLFQDKLGTVRQRADRLRALAGYVALQTGATDEEEKLANQAGLYAKADLASGLVGELSSLQGVIGGEYARREGFPEPVCHAIACQYDLGKNPHPTTVESKTAVRLLVADQLDKLVGFLGLGLLPKGSSDPFGLRRAATLLIEAAWSWPDTFPGYSDSIREAVTYYMGQSIDLQADNIAPALAEIFRGRYEALLPDLSHDVLTATVTSASDSLALDPCAIRTRTQAMTVLSKDTALVQTMTRPLNILAAAQKKADFSLPDALHVADLQSPTGELLATHITKANDEARHALHRGESGNLVELFERLQGDIHDFFEATMIMADEPQVRAARLKLVAEASEVLLMVGDFSQIVIEG